MIPEVQKYNDAIAAMTKAKEQIGKIAAIVQRAAEKLRDPQTATFIGVSGLSLPLNPTTVSIAGAIDLSAWPTAQEIAEAIAGYHHGRTNLRAAFEKIPKHSRQGLLEPQCYS